MYMNIESIEATKHIAEIINKHLFSGMIICLDGDLGAGKTTLTQFISNYMGINEYVTSPTFNIIKEYNSKIPLYHMDVYRIESYYDMYDLGYEEYINGDGVTIIEWSEKIKEILPKERISIYIKRDNEKRIFDIKIYGEKYKKLLEELEQYENTMH